MRLLFLFISLAVFSCNHPSVSQESSQTSTQDGHGPGTVIPDIEAGIKAHIDREVEKGNGYFHLQSDSFDLKLKLVRVHTEYLANLGPEYNFACVDLADVSGEVYDVDFFMKGPVGEMEVTETTVHKLNGQPYYTWEQDKEDKTWYRVPVDEASNELLGIIEGEDNFEFYYHITVPKIDEDARMWVPIPRSDDYQKVKLLAMESPVPHREVVEEKHGNSVFYFELSPEHSAEVIEITWDVKRSEKMPYEADSQPGDFLAGTDFMPVGGFFKDLADSIIGDKQDHGDLVCARSLYDYVIDHVKYMKYGDYGRGDSQYACSAGSGNCSEFHSLFISLARSSGIPSRFAIGVGVPSERDDGGIDGYHCWAEFYAEGKWWPVDISEANKYTPLATYYFGHQPANRLELSRGRDLVIDPEPVESPINFLAFPVFEVGGQPKDIVPFFSFQRKR